MRTNGTFDLITTFRLGPSSSSLSSPFLLFSFFFLFLCRNSVYHHCGSVSLLRFPSPRSKACKQLFLLPSLLSSSSPSPPPLSPPYLILIPRRLSGFEFLCGLEQLHCRTHAREEKANLFDWLWSREALRLCNGRRATTERLYGIPRHRKVTSSWSLSFLPLLVPFLSLSSLRFAAFSSLISSLIYSSC